MGHRWEIRKNKVGEYVACFMYNKEIIWRSEGYNRKSAAMNAILSFKRMEPSAKEIYQTEDDPLDIFRHIEVPAADRIVSPDHNSKAFRNFEKAHAKLAEKLRSTNDLRNFETDELFVARHEVAMIGEEAKKSSLRTERLWSMAKSTIFWIVQKAADAVIKTLAVGALIALAAMLGIRLPIG